METFRRLETPKIWAVIMTQTIGDDGTLADGSLTDPDTSVKVIVEDGTGTVVQALADMVKSATGKYYYESYTIATDANAGIYDYEIRATNAGKVSVIHGSFKVEAQVA